MTTRPDEFDAYMAELMGDRPERKAEIAAAWDAAEGEEYARERDADEHEDVLARSVES